MKNRFLKTLTSLVLAILMVATLLPAMFVGTFAAEEQTYVKVTTAPTDWSGTYLIVYEDGNVAFDGSLTSFDAVGNTKSVTIADGTITGDFAACTFTIAAVDGGYSIQGASGKYIGQASDKNGLTTNNSALINTISLNADGSVNIIGAGGAYLRYNATANQTRFRYYKSTSYSNQKAIALYKRQESTSGGDTECAHANTTNVAEVPATCSALGYTAGVLCDDCGKYISGHEEISKLAHTEEIDAAVDATCTTAGKTEGSHCSVCGETIVAQTDIPAAHTYVDGVCSECGELDPLPAEGSVLTIPEFNAIGVANSTYTDRKYLVTGVITEITNTYYGNMYIKDADGNTLLIYGVYNIDGTVRFDAMDPQPAVGDTITVLGVAGQYNGTAQMKNGWVQELVSLDCAHTNTEVLVAVPATCTESGLTEGLKCLDCGNVLTEQETIPAGHNYVDGVCTVCDEKKPFAQTYTFADHASGTQYAENEAHVLDGILTVTTTQAHFTTELRLYSSSSHDAFAIFSSALPIQSIVLNAGNKADTLNVYTSTDGTTWTLAEGVATTTSYEDHTVTFSTATKYIKLDVAGTQQVRIKSVTANYDAPEAKGWSISLKGDIGVNFYYNTAWFAENSNAVITATVGGNEVASYNASDLTANANGLYVVRCDVRPDQMDTAIVWTVKFGDTVVASKTVTVREYINTVKDLETTPANLKTLLNAMDAYGTAVENYKGTATVEKDHENALNNVVVTPENSDAEGALTINAVSGTLDSTNGLNFHFTAAEGYTFDDYTLTVTFRGHTVVDNKKLSYFAEDNADATGIDMSIDGMIASDLDEKVTVSIALATDATVVSTISCSFMDYVCLQYNLAENANNYKLLNLLNAIANYSAAAEAYFGK